MAQPCRHCGGFGLYCFCQFQSTATSSGSNINDAASEFPVDGQIDEGKFQIPRTNEELILANVEQDNLNPPPGIPAPNFPAPFEAEDLPTESVVIEREEGLNEDHLPNQVADLSASSQNQNRKESQSEKSNSGQCLNLSPSLESSGATGRLYLPTAEELNYQTPTVDFLSLFDRLNPALPPPLPETVEPIIPGPRQGLSPLVRNLATGSIILQGRVDGESFSDEVTALSVSFQALNLNEDHLLQHPQNNPAPTIPRRLRGLLHLARNPTGSVFSLTADGVNPAFSSGIRRRRHDKDEEEEKGQAKKPRN